jgi:hypothetical protein
MWGSGVTLGQRCYKAKYRKEKQFLPRRNPSKFVLIKNKSKTTTTEGNYTAKTRVSGRDEGVSPELGLQEKCENSLMGFVSRQARDPPLRM